MGTVVGVLIGGMAVSLGIGIGIEDIVLLGIPVVCIGGRMIVVHGAILTFVAIGNMIQDDISIYFLLASLNPFIKKDLFSEKNQIETLTI
jgi:hypothetical protein